MKKSHLILIVVSLLNISSATAQSQYLSYLQRTTPFERSLENLMNLAYRVGRGNYVMQFEGKVKNEAHVFGFAIYVNKMGIADSVVFTNKTPLLDSIVSFNRIAESIQKDQKIFQNHKNTVIVSMGLVERYWDEYILNVDAFKDQLFNVFPKLYPEEKRLHIVGPITFGAVMSGS